MKIASSVSIASDSRMAAEEAATEVAADLGGAAADLVFLFISPHHSSHAEEVGEIVREKLPAAHFVGCTAEGVLGGDREFADSPGLSLWAASLPGVDFASCRLESAEEGQNVLLLEAMTEMREPTTMVLVADPFSVVVEDLIDELAESRPELVFAGGMASGSNQPTGNRFYYGEEVFDQGGAAVLFRGGRNVSTVVSQGCRPFGKPLVVTSCEDNMIKELGGESAWQKFIEQVELTEDADRERLTEGLHVGRAVDSRSASEGAGNFLVRGVLGFVKENGAMMVSDITRAGQTVQFHLRDPASASQEMENLLQAGCERLDGKVAGALLFTCNGRGPRMFDRPHHDAALVSRIFNGTPLAGFFAAGEIGPIGDSSFLHGFTAVTVLFHPS
ncbi:MAG: FIST N-terminal domain-containing protein [Planctomycetota bacterium]|nr:FIST N-terminal domain-containing protein [Planctomycetota bacterium]